MDKDKDLLRFLEQLITEYSNMYYNMGFSDVSDDTFDALKRRLIALEKDMGVKERVSLEVGARPVGEVLTRPYKMLSLSNVYNVEELMDWLDTLPPNSQVAIEHKLDGMALELTYVDGKLEHATTRGDGLLGEIVTEHALYLSGVPKTIPRPKGVGKTILLRGEVIIYTADFQVANTIGDHIGGDTYKYPRSMVAGLFRKTDPKVVSDNNLKFICYEAIVERNGEWISHPLSDFNNKMSDGLHRFSPEYIGPNNNKEDIKSVIERCTTLRKEYEYVIDGLVIKCVDSELRTKLGNTTSYPNWATAYKFPPEEVISKILDVIWQVGRTGIVTPVAIVEPVNVSGLSTPNATGTTVSRVGLYNYKEIERLGLNQTGVDIVIALRGDVIPKIVQVLPSLDNASGDPITVPDKCPSCGTPLETEDEMVQSKHLVCTNRHGCNDQIIQRLTYFGSRNGLHIKGMGNAIVRKMVQCGITRPVDLYIRPSPEVLNNLKDSIGEKTYGKLVRSVSDSPLPPFHKLLNAVSIEGVGAVVSESIAEKYDSFKTLSEATVEELAQIRYVGYRTAESIVTELRRAPEEYLILDKVFKYVMDDDIHENK